MKSLIQTGLVLTALIIMSACQVEEKGPKSSADFSANPGFSEKSNNGKTNLKVNLEDRSSKGSYDDIDQVVVTIKEVLLKVNGGEVSIAQNIGAVDLMTLSSGRQIGIADTEIPVGSKINQIRLVLEETGNYIQYFDGTFCDMQTPSQQQSGLKVVNPDFVIGEGEA